MYTIGAMAGSATMQAFIVEMPNITQHTHNITETQEDVQLEIVEKSNEMLTYAFMVPGVFSMVVAIFYIGLCITLPTIDLTATKQISTGNTMAGRKQNHLTVLLLIFVSMFSFLQRNLENILENYLTRFTLAILDTSAHYAAMVTTIFFIAFGFSRLACICVSYLLTSGQMLCVNLALGAAAYAIMLLVPTYKNIALIVSVVLAGLSLAANYASLVTWSTLHIQDTVKVTSLITIARSLSGVFGLPVTGYLLDHWGDMWMVYVLFSDNIIIMMLFLAMNMLVKYFFNVSDVDENSVK